MQNEIQVRYKMVSHTSQVLLPSYATAGSAGMDLHACLTEPVELEPGQRIRIPTGIALEMPGSNVVGLVYARSGLAWKHGLGLPNGVGVIDSDYTGELQILLINFGTERTKIEPGDRVAQIVFAPVYAARLVEVEQLQATERGVGGFGSTGVKP